MFSLADGADFWVGIAEAFVLAFLIVAIDCHDNVKAVLQRVTVPLYSVPSAWLVWTACGLFGAGAFTYSVTAPSTSWISQALSLGTTNNFYRGFFVGASVLVLIRSKVLTIASTEIGGEYFYNKDRALILKQVNRKRARAKDQFLATHLDRIVTIQDFDARLISFVTDFVADDLEANRNAIATQFQRIQSIKPDVPFDVGNRNAAQNAQWRTYYRILAGVAVECCGVAEISRLLQ
jgi:hypothetical protein